VALLGLVLMYVVGLCSGIQWLVCRSQCSIFLEAIMLSSSVCLDVLWHGQSICGEVAIGGWHAESHDKYHSHLQ